MIEHEELMYVEHQFITELLDYELRYDEEDTFAEIFEGKGDFIYESSHEDGALMDLGQIYVEEEDAYENIDSNQTEYFQFIEFEEKLYIPERFIHIYMKSPMNLDRRDKVLEIGEFKESVSVSDVGLANTGSNIEITQNAEDVTVEGENYGAGIVISNINSSSKSAEIDVDYNYSKFKGFIYNKTDKSVQIDVKYEDDLIIDSFEIGKQKSQKFSYDLKGKEVITISAKLEPGASEEVVIIGDLN